MVYERVPRTIHRRTLRLASAHKPDDPHTILTLIIRSLPMSLLAVSRQVHEEAKDILSNIAQDFILPATPKVIFENEEVFNIELFQWLLALVSIRTKEYTDAEIRNPPVAIDQGKYGVQGTIYIAHNIAVSGISDTEICADYRQHLFKPRTWMNPQPIGTILQANNMKEHAFRFIDQSGRQLAMIEHARRPIEIVLGMWYEGVHGGYDNRYSVVDGFFSTEMWNLENAAEEIIEPDKDCSDSPIQLVIAGYLDKVDGSTPIAIPGESFVEEDCWTYSSQMTNERWRSEWM